MVYVTSKEACKQLGVHPNSLRNWDKAGKVRTKRTPGGKRLYDLSSLEGNNLGKIIYARVSSKGQKDDLEKQIEYLRSRYPDHEVIEDFGSGLNFKRKGFKHLLERIIQGTVSEVVITHKDRLCRFGFDLVSFIAEKFSCRILVLDESQSSPQEELVKDLLSIVHVFSCRLYGLRKYSKQIKEDKNLFEQGKQEIS